MRSLTLYIKVLLALSGTLQVAGCGLLPYSNSSTAVIQESQISIPDLFNYRIILTGKGQPLVHDPFSLVFQGPYEYQHEIFTNSLTGRIDSSALVFRIIGSFSERQFLEGFIEFSDDVLIINLYHRYDRKAYTFNGRYTIEHKKVSEIPKISLTSKSELNQWEAREIVCLIKKDTLSPKEYCSCLGNFYNSSTGRCSHGNDDFIQRIAP